MHPSVNPLPYEAGMGLEGVLAAVLQDEPAFRVQYFSLKDLVRNSFEPFQGIRRVGENNIELLVAYAEEIKDILVDGCHIPKTQPHGLTANELGIVAVHLHRPDPSHSPGAKFKSN